MRRFLILMAAVGLAVSAALGAGTYTNEDLGLSGDDLLVSPGALILAQRIRMVVTDSALLVTELTVANTAGSNRLQGTDIDYIEVRRDSVTGPVLRNQASGLTNFHTTGVTFPTVTTASIREFSVGTHYLLVLIKLKASVPLERDLALGGTKIGITVVDYTAREATVFTVGPAPSVEFDSTALSDTVYRGQFFLAARLVIDATSVPFLVPITQVVLKNTASTGTKLAGEYINRIEVRRAVDGTPLTSQTALTGLTTTGVAFSMPTNTSVAAYSELWLEIWVELRTTAPTGHYLKLGAEVRCGGADFPATGAADEFVVGEADGLDPITSLPVLEGGAEGQVFSGQRFLAQRIEVVDFDDDPYDVTINSVVVRNVAGANRLAEGQITAIEIISARDGAAMADPAAGSGLNSGGVRITTSRNNIVWDDTTEILEIWITLAPDVPHDRRIQLESVIWHTEDTQTFGKPHDGASSEFVTGPALDGFKKVEAVALTDRTVFQGARFIAQGLVLEDDDPDPYDVIITSVMVRNAAATSVLADQHVARLEVRRASDGALLGEVVDPVGLSLAGVRVTTSANNVVPDDTSVELQIWITLKDTAPEGRKLKIESIVWHTEGTATFQKGPPAGPATFTTALGSRPTGVDFSWEPVAPNAEDEITFTPAAGIADPEGDIANATFSWTFGDGSIAQTTGSLAVKHTYNKGGTFSVTLTVTGVGGLSTSKTHEVQVKGQEPTVDFTFTPPSPMVGQEIQFTSVVTDPATPPLTPYTYAWNFGDETTSTEANPRHTYTATGTYTVALEVTNSESETGRVSRALTVVEAVDVPPTVTNLTASPANPETGVEVTFTAPATAPAGDPVTGWEWDFGDGSAKSTTTAGTAKHTFAASNVFTVSVRAQNEKGGWSQPRTLSLYVRPKGGAAIGTKPLDNPARTQARIQLFLPQGASGVKIQIFDLLGRTVRSGDVTGTQFNWDLRDGNGRALADGLYFYLVTATVADKVERSAVGRILVVR